MRLEVLSHHVSLAVDRMRRVAPLSVFVLRRGIHKHNGVATPCGFLCLLHDRRVIARNRCMEAGLAFLCRGNVAVFGEHDQIHAVVALIDQLDHFIVAVIQILCLKGIIRLNDTCFHKKSLPFICMMEPIGFIIAQEDPKVKKKAAPYRSTKRLFRYFVS